MQTQQLFNFLSDQLQTLLPRLPQENNFLTPQKIRLGKASCNPFVSSDSRSSTDDTSVGGAVRPLSDNLASSKKRWRRVVRVPLSRHISVRASACEHERGNGRIALKRRVKRYVEGEPPDDCEETDHEDEKYQEESPHVAIVCHPQPFCRLWPMEPLKKGIANLSRLASNNPLFGDTRNNEADDEPYMVKYECIYRAELKTSSKLRNTVTLSAEDGDFGKAKIVFAPKNRFASSCKFTSSALSQINQKLGNGLRPRFELNGDQLDMLESSLNYSDDNKWSGNLRVGTTSDKELSIVVNNDPFLFNYSFRLPLCQKRPSFPVVSWDHFDSASVGLQWKNGVLRVFQDHVSANFNLKDDVGSVNLDLSTKKHFSVRRQLNFELFDGHTTLSLGSKLSNNSALLSSDARLSMPWGSVEARTATDGSYRVEANFSVERDRWTFESSLDMQQDCSDEKLEFRASFRFGLFY